MFNDQQVLNVTEVDMRFINTLVTVMSDEIGNVDENPRPSYSDDTPAHTRFITDEYEKYNAWITPITSLRPIAWKSGIREMLWIYQDQTSELFKLEERKVKWWKPWDVGNGTIGQIYGATVRRYNLVDRTLKELKDNPFGRRHVINLWQEIDLDEPNKIVPCAFMTEWAVRKSGDEYILDCSLTQRSSDYATAAHINMVQYKALQMMFAKHLGYKVGTFSRKTMNLHIYDRHIPQVKRILDVFNNTPKQRVYSVDDLPQLILDVPDGTNFYDVKDTDFKMINYSPIKYEPKLEFDLGI